MLKKIIILSALLLSACATPETPKKFEQLSLANDVIVHYPTGRIELTEELQQFLDKWVNGHRISGHVYYPKVAFARFNKGGWFVGIFATWTRVDNQEYSGPVLKKFAIDGEVTDEDRCEEAGKYNCFVYAIAVRKP